MPKHIPFFSLEPTHQSIHRELMDEFEKTLAKNWFILGDNLAKFEENFAKFIGAKYCLGVGNGYDAIKLSLQALGINSGEVILPAHTFAACGMSIAETGAIPVFVDVSAENCNISGRAIEAKISKNTRAIMAVHLYGLPCEMDKLLKISQKYDIPIIEDNAQAHGASYKGQNTGTFGLVSATSFYPTKNLGALGDGGAVTTNDENMFLKLAKLRNYGSNEKYVHSELGSNSRLDEIQAAFLLVKLSKLDQWNRERQAIAKQYTEGLGHIPELILPKVPAHSEHVFHIYQVRTAKRDSLQNYLQKYGVQTLVHYPIPLHLQPAFAYLGHQKGDFPIAEEIANTTLSLPLYPGLKETDVEYVVEKIRGFFKGN